MNICIYGKKFDPRYADAVSALIHDFIQRGAQISVYEKFASFLSGLGILPPDVPVFRTDDDLRDSRLLVSIGGDGTLLDSARFVAGLETPVLGINTGRLGFLSTVNISDSLRAIDAIFSGNYGIDKRSMIKVECPQLELGDKPFALNEVSILNRDRNSMVRIHVEADGVFLNSYWADGLILATPTGSTAYSLSCGGPIVTPDSQNFILTPIAAHNLTMRPVVIADRSVLTLRAEGRSPNFLLTIDSKSYQFGPDARIELTRAPFDLCMVHLSGTNFFQTVRSKMGWGMDQRN